MCSSGSSHSCVEWLEPPNILKFNSRDFIVCVFTNGIIQRKVIKFRLITSWWLLVQFSVNYMIWSISKSSHSVWFLLHTGSQPCWEIWSLQKHKVCWCAEVTSDLVWEPFRRSGQGLLYPNQWVKWQLGQDCVSLRPGCCTLFFTRVIPDRLICLWTGSTGRSRGRWSSKQLLHQKEEQSHQRPSVEKKKDFRLWVHWVMGMEYVNFWLQICFLTY